MSENEKLEEELSGTGGNSSESESTDGFKQTSDGTYERVDSSEELSKACDSAEEVKDTLSEVETQDDLGEALGDTEDNFDTEDEFLKKANTSEEFNAIFGGEEDGVLIPKSKKAKKQRKAKKRPKWLVRVGYVLDVVLCVALVLCMIVSVYGFTLYSGMKKSAEKLVTSYNNQEFDPEIVAVEEPYFNEDGSLSDACLEWLGGSDYRTQSIKDINDDNMVIEKYIGFKEYFDKQLATDKAGLTQLMEQLDKTETDKYISNYTLIEQALKALDDYGDDYVYYVMLNYMSDIDSMEYMRAGLGGLSEIIGETDGYALGDTEGNEIDPSDQTTFVMNLTDIIDRVVVDEKLKDELQKQSALIDRLVNNYIGLAAMLKAGSNIQSQLGDDADTEELLDSLEVTNVDYALSQLSLIMNGDIEVRTLYFNDETQAAFDELNERTADFSDYVKFVPFLDKLFDEDKVFELSTEVVNKATEVAGRADEIKYDDAFSNELFKQDFLGLGLTSAMFTNMSTMYITDNILSINEARLGVMFEIPVGTMKPTTVLEDGARRFGEYLDGAMLALNGLQAGGESFLGQYTDEDGNIKEGAVFDKTQTGYKELMTYYAIYGSMQNRANNFATY